MKKPNKRLLKWLSWTLILVTVIITGVLAYFSYSSFQREASTSEILAPKTGKFIKVEDVSVFYQELGPADGTPVILLHGTGSWSEIWRETMTALSEKGYRAIAIDIPPFGFSGKPGGVDRYSTENQGARINAVLDSLNIKGGVLVGHSVGCRPTLEALLNNRERIDRLVLVDAALGFAEDSLHPHFQQNDPGFLIRQVFNFKWLRNTLIGATATNPDFTKTFLKSFVYNKEAISDKLAATLQVPYAINHTSIATADWFEYLTVTTPHKARSSDFRNFLTLKIPVLILWGDKDDITPLWQGEALTTLIPGSKLRIIRNTGHIPYIEDPKQFNESLIEFLNDAE